ncbi:hypothetical protein [Mucilaginibacter gynuensis]|uniref:hypothetical protein n=1 Tax=Mucilaginibacter gynuensis TaxID=1302236 RepID=UPI0031EBF753
MQLEKSYWFLILISAFYFFVAWNSSGYNNADEHFQIIEFANYKLGHSTINDLAWEYKARVRPGLQPALCYLVFNSAYLLGISDKYNMALILRFMSALVSLVVIYWFVIGARPVIAKRNFNYFVVLSFLLWFLPYINVRFSSESWSGTLFMASLAAIQSQYHKGAIKKPFILGILLGASILFRYQSSLLVMGTILWLLFVDKAGLKKISIITSSIITMLLLGFFIDRWLYDANAFSLYNYFYVNIVKGVASNYGTSPWYEIMWYIIISPGIIGIYIFSAIIILLIIEPKSILLWAIAPFLIVHSIIPHKELRFLFPIANLVPFILILAYQKTRHLRLLKIRLFKYAASAIFLVVNTAGLVAITCKGAGKADISVTQYIHRHYSGQKVNVLCIDGLNPYWDYVNPRSYFYNSNEVELTFITTIWQNELVNKRKKGLVNLLIISDNEIAGQRSAQLLEENNFVKVFQSIPDVVKAINNFYDPSLNDYNLIVYEYGD